MDRALLHEMSVSVIPEHDFVPMIDTQVSEEIVHLGASRFCRPDVHPLMCCGERGFYMIDC